ncbi:uncharacterized protein [Malus domestica]|uniref:uncharacterized protein n=1 Tax=Malus domestica TaxID=3750 RepID=UPI0039749E2F
MFVVGKDKLGYLFGSNPQPPIDDPAFTKWRTENAIMKGWLINSMEPNLIGYSIQLPTTKEVWDVVARTYYDSSDISQVYDLTCKASRMRQDGRPIETYYSDLQSLWQEIDYHRPNPMKCGTDIEIFNKIVQTDRVYTLLAGLDKMFGKIHSDILRTESLPSVEQTFAYLQKQQERDEQANIATFMSQLSLISQDDPPTVSNSSDMSPESSGNCGYAFNMNSDATPSGWIIDSCAKDHMTYDPTNLACDTVPLRCNITNANGVTSPFQTLNVTLAYSPRVTVFLIR